VASVTRRRGSQDTSRRSSTEDQILAATERLLSDGTGFTDIGVQKIAEAAGVARSSFYVIFPDKTAVLLRLARGLKQGLLAIATEWHPDTTEAGLPGLVGTYTRMPAFYRAHSGVVAAVTEVAAYDRAVREFWDGCLEAFARQTAARITAEKEAGRTAAGMDPLLAARVAI
jgi:AcrR family transcriptional regulator